MQKQREIRWALGALVAVVAFISFTVAGWAGDPQFGTTEASLAPAGVTGGSDVLYTATFPYQGRQTLTHGEVVITFPADWTYATPSAPDVCTQTSATTLRCDRETLRPGDPPVTQAVRFTTPTALTPQLGKQVSSFFTYDEGGSDQDRGRSDRALAPDQFVDVLPPSDNHTSKCASKNGDTVATKGGISETNALSTAIVVPSTTALCSPVSVQEFPLGAPASACPEGVDCTTGVSVTSTPLYTTGNPIKLIFEVYGKPKSWFKDGVLVPPCTGAAGTASPDPCISGRSNISKGLRLTVLSSGNDPSWEGA
jgi:hypothetical protein